MNDVEQRLEAAAVALVRTFPDSEVPPLHLPARPARMATGPGRWRRARGWLIPLAAGVAVVAAITAPLAVIHAPARTTGHHPGGTVNRGTRTGAAGLGGVPPYYVLIHIARPEVTSTATGRTLATVRRPRYTYFQMVSAAADDRTFVVGGSVIRGPGPDDPFRFFLLRFDPAHDTARLTSLPFSLPPSPVIPAGLAVSPDGTRLAVVRSTLNQLKITVYTLATGASRTWTGQNISAVPPFNNPCWAGDGQTLEFVSTSARTHIVYVGLLNTNAPGTVLPAGTALAPGSKLHEVQMSSDGTLLAATEQKSPTWGIREFAVRTLRPVYHLGPITPAMIAYDVYWTNSTGSLMIGRSSTQLGILGHGRFLRLPGQSAAPNLISW